VRMPVLPNVTWSKSFFTGGMLILYQSHHDIYACTLGLATTSGSDEMDSTLEYMLSGVPGFLWPRSVVPGAQAAAS
jgi:hypothetical protein